MTDAPSSLAGFAVTPHLDLELTGLALHGLVGLAVAADAGIAAFTGVRLVTRAVIAASRALSQVWRLLSMVFRVPGCAPEIE